ncbi:MAG: hypothetical protein WD872_14805 [Pirellulaceae bacterium]
MITKQTVAERLAAYLRHDISPAELVDWAENAVMDGEFDEQDNGALLAMVARLGVADVRAFGLTWEDCEAMLRALGYDARVEVVPV